MANFNTYQTRNLYVAKAVDSSLDGAGDVYMGTTATGEIFFKCVNGDGKVVRTDLIRPDSIISLKKTAAADMDYKLKKHTIAVDTNAVTLANLVGKTLTCTITFHCVGSYNENDTFAVTAAIVGNSTNTANATAFHKALAEAIAKVLPERDYPLLKVFSNGTEVKKGDTATGAAGGVVLVEAPQKYRRGLMDNKPYEFTVAFMLHDGNTGDIAWGTDTVAASDVTNNIAISSTYEIADLEWFTLGERGDDKRGYWYPMNYEPTYLVDLTKQYDIVSIEYYWQGNAENVQKSPRMIQIACEVSGSGSGASSDAATIYGAVKDAMEGKAGSGSGA